ncbi:unknown [Bacteroides sp. CAG:1060]|nr:unknown [Bacteroides sp. CAG:1060]
MTLLEISTAAMSAYSGSLVIVCAIASAVILVFSFFHEKLKIFNTKHKFFTCSNTIVKPISWNGGKDGIDRDGVPFYGSFEDKSQDAQTDSADTHTKETER